MNAVTFACIGIGLWFLGKLVLDLADLAARFGRYRNYRAMYPSAERGRVWRHVR